MSKNKKINWQGIIGVILIVALSVGTFVGISAIETDKTKSISSTEFSVGGLDTKTGLYVETDQSIYTKDLIKCEGLNIKRDFEAEGTYQVFFYKVGGDFSHVTPIMNSEDREYSFNNDAWPDVKYCRIVITPNLESEDKVHFYDVLKYASLYDISVNKKQTIKYDDAYSLGNISINSIEKDIKLKSIEVGETAGDISSVGHFLYSFDILPFTTRKYEKLDILIRKSESMKDFDIDYVIVSGEGVITYGNSVSVDNLKGPWMVITVDISSVDEYSMIWMSMPANTSVYVIEYNE